MLSAIAKEFYRYPDHDFTLTKFSAPWWAEDLTATNQEPSSSDADQKEPVPRLSAEDRSLYISAYLQDQLKHVSQEQLTEKQRTALMLKFEQEAHQVLNQLESPEEDADIL